MSENELLLVLRGDPQAIRTFIHEYGPILRSQVRRMVFGSWRDREEDLLQDLLFGLLRDDARVLRLWDPKKGKTLKSFLIEFARRRIVDFLRRQHRESREIPTGDTNLLRQAEQAPSDVP